MRYLLLISILLFAACASSKKYPQQSAGNKPATFQWDTTTAFKANIKVLNQEYTGMVILNRESDSSYRVILTTGVGPKLIDMSLTSNGYIKYFAIKQLNRKALLNMFWEDFGTMVNIFSNNNPYSDTSSNSYCFQVRKRLTACYYYKERQPFPVNADFKDGKKLKTKFSYFYDGKNHPDSIVIEHLSFKMNYFLKKLN